MTYHRRVAEERVDGKSDTVGASGGALFSEVARAARLSDRVTDLMLETIMSERLRIGDRLPSERELGEQFGVSRAVVREAVRALVAKGVIEARPGSGLRVAAVGAAAVSESIGLYLRGGSLEYGKMHEVRRLIDVEIAGLAAERATDDDLAQMSGICERMKRAVGRNIEEALRLDLEFHLAIARSTDNELYLLLLNSIGEALLEIRRGYLQTGAGTKAIRIQF
jgi:GntR family transcriptional repressor for pyruvate dehydrogenase complex